MDYSDASVLLAAIFDEPVQPPASFWDGQLIASRLAMFEVWTRIHSGRTNTRELIERADIALSRVIWMEMTPDVLSCALSPFPISIRTPDALHLATLVFAVSESGQPIRLASYDIRMIKAAEAIGIETFQP